MEPGIQSRPEIVATAVRYVLYARKSSEGDERQALSIDSQVKEMLAIAERESLEVVDIRREAHSAKDSGQRPVFNEVLADLRANRFNGILVWHPDRLARNAGDLGNLVDLMDQKALLDIRTYGQSFGNSPSDKFLLMILGSQAKLDNDNKSVNVKRGLRMRCEMGLWPAQAPTGYLNVKTADQRGVVVVDPERAPVIRQMFEKVAYEHWSGRKIYHWLRFELNFRTPLGNKHLTLSNVHKILGTPFYYGSFEYPSKSGNWYTGRHEPIITKDLYDAVQARLHRDMLTHEPKEFAFARMAQCGLCGSSISGERKVRDRKGGRVAVYTYYGCNRSKDRNCKAGYVREDDLLEQVLGLVDELEWHEALARNKFTEEYERMLRFQAAFLEADSTDERKDFDVREYARYVLQAGTLQEKRELLGLLKTTLLLEGKKVSVRQ